ncbi:MAG TPA: NUDIX domain-containing protein [Chloroflexota bacterium]|jgi:8-oxo-dGTP pyrophosphatase MutT (NUDIX family)|nr:NUDIX domain-containing protein [Chloroflexota bacterium]
METQTAPAQTLAFAPDQFKGIIVRADELPDDASFPELLKRSIETWTAAEFRLIWLNVPLERAALVPVAVKEGFFYHHANEGEVMLVRRLVEDAFVPTHATHYIGVGGVVINERNELLVVCERHRRTQQRYYKLPGGALQPGEHLVDAVVREVVEETGVEVKFERLVCFRHWHGYRYGKSDIYFVCRLSPLSQDISKQDAEIEECIWMPVEEYLAHELVSPFNRRIVKAALNATGVMPEWIEGHTDPARYEFFMPDETRGPSPAEAPGAS